MDSTGLSIVGEREWAAAKHGGKGKRGWKKLHLGVDRAGAIVAQVLTDGNADDATTALGLIDTVEGNISSLTGDAAYDTVAIYDAARVRGANVIVPPTRTAAVSRRGPRSAVRDDTIRRVQEIGRRRWKKESGYHRASPHRERLLSVQTGHRGSSPCLSPEGAGSGGGHRVQHPEPDDRAGPTPLIRGRGLRSRGRGGAALVGFMHQRRVFLLPRFPELTRLHDLISFGAPSHGSHVRCLRFAVPVNRQPRKTRFRLEASLCRAGFAPAGFLRVVSRHVMAIPHSRALPGTLRARSRTRGRSTARRRSPPDRPDRVGATAHSRRRRPSTRDPRSTGCVC